jgi:type I restriction enzyme M protein
VLFINAIEEVTRERARSFLKDEHQERITKAYRAFGPVDGFASVATVDQIIERAGNLSIPLYVKKAAAAGLSDGGDTFTDAWTRFDEESPAFWRQMDELAVSLGALVSEASRD